MNPTKPPPMLVGCGRSCKLLGTTKGSPVTSLPDELNYLNLPLNRQLTQLTQRRAEHAPIPIDRAVVELVESFKFLGVHITNKLSWSKHTKTVVKRSRQRPFPLRRLKIFGMGPQILKKFYSFTIESITAWYCNCSASDCKALQRVVRTAQ